MTCTLRARCPLSGALGIGIATYSLAVGGLCPVASSGVGAMKSPAFVNPTLGTLGARLLRAGHPAAQVPERLRGADPHVAFRAVALLDRRGDVAIHAGARCRTRAGHVEGPGCVARGHVRRDAASAPPQERFVASLH